MIAFYRLPGGDTPRACESYGSGLADAESVRGARPNFAGHHQPHLPVESDDCDASGVASLAAHAARAAAYGIHGFCFLCRWSGDAGAFNRAIAAMADSNKPGFPFCICLEADDAASKSEQGDDSAPPGALPDEALPIRALLPVLADVDYIRVGGRPLVLVLRSGPASGLARVAAIWRDECVRAGVVDAFLCCVDTALGGVLPANCGFDAAFAMPPYGFHPESHRDRLQLTNTAFAGEVRSYRSYIAQTLAVARPPYKRFSTVMPGWDETPRNQNAGLIFEGSTPELFGVWVERAARRTRLRFSGDERLLFVRSWNEWDRGCHLEPDRRFGVQYLDALSDGLAGSERGAPERPAWSAVRAWSDADGGASAARIVRSARPNQAFASACLVSVVMPAYNHERFVVAALDSVLAQTYENFELIVVDDGSHDATASLLDDYAARHPAVRLTVVHQSNAGAHEAINHGLALAGGEVVALINSDDLFVPMRLARLLAEMGRREAAFAFSATRFIDEDGAEFGGDDPYVAFLRAVIAEGARAPDPVYALLATNIAISTGNFVFRRDLLERTGGFSAMKACHDWDFVLAASYHTPLVMVDEPLYQYRLHRANTFSGLRLAGGLESDEVIARFFAGIAEHPVLRDPTQAARFVDHVRRIGLQDYLNERADARR